MAEITITSDEVSSWLQEQVCLKDAAGFDAVPTVLGCCGASHSLAEMKTSGKVKLVAIEDVASFA